MFWRRKKKPEFIFEEPTVVNVGPDDLLVFETDRRMSRDQFERLKSQIKKSLDGRMPGINFIVTEGLKLRVIHRERCAACDVLLTGLDLDVHESGGCPERNHPGYP